MGYGALVAAQLSGEDLNDAIDDDDFDEDASVWERIWQGWVMDLWVHPRQIAVKRMVDRWWSRYGLLVFLPAALVSSFFVFLPFDLPFAGLLVLTR